MTKIGLRVDDIGESFTWIDFRDFLVHLPPTGDSALYRDKHPQSWWWTPEHDFLAAVLTSLQWGNWQRGGGRGDKPQQVKRPVEKPKKSAGAIPTTSDELTARKNALKQKIERTVERGN
jgi:hypothetical protein